MQDYRFFPNPDRLRELLQKELDSKYAGYFQGVEYVEFTEEDRIEKDILLSKGFTNWDRRDYQKFCQAIEMFPREETDLWLNHIGTKTKEELLEYQKVFFANLHKLTDHKKIKRNIEKAEALFSFKQNAPQLIRQKVTAYEKPVEEMVI